MSWLKELFWCETWSEFFRNLALAIGLLITAWASIWALYIVVEVL
jgi:hypothetical protein